MTETTSEIFEIVERGAAQYPDQPALEFGDTAWTWRDLHDRILRLAAALRAEGVSAGDRIGFLDKNHPACLETTFAASLLGAANAVFNFRLAPAEIAYVINDSQASVIIVGEEFIDVVQGLRDEIPGVKRVVVLGGERDEYQGLLDDAGPLEVRHQASPDDCFLQLYTSGTTGFPKGAMLTQRSMAAHNRALLPAYDMDSAMVNLVAMPLFHVGGTCWALGSMCAGGRTVLVREVVPAQILDTIEQTRATHAFFVPAVIQMLLALDNFATSTATLRVIGYGGSPMPAPLMAKTLETIDTPMYSVYGMTEMSGVFCALGPEEHRDPERRHLHASAGKPLAGTSVRVVDPNTGTDVAPGQVGEFWIKSEQCMGGYWNKPDETAQAMVDGWLRSGDAGRIDEQGYLYIEDRVNDMVITGGENVYPAEVERVLVDHPDVAEVAVIGLPDEKWGSTVHAVVVPVDGHHVDAEKLIEHARGQLAHYKCPTGVTLVDALPRNPTGKVLKRELRSTLQ